MFVSVPTRALKHHVPFIQPFHCSRLLHWSISDCWRVKQDSLVIFSRMILCSGAQPMLLSVMRCVRTIQSTLPLPLEMLFRWLVKTPREHSQSAYVMYPGYYRADRKAVLKREQIPLEILDPQVSRRNIWYSGFCQTNIFSFQQRKISRCSKGEIFGSSQEDLLQLKIMICFNL